MTALHDRARRLAGEVCENQGDCACVDAESVCARCRSIELAPAFASAMVSLARDFAREAIRGMTRVVRPEPLGFLSPTVRVVIDLPQADGIIGLGFGDGPNAEKKAAAWREKAIEAAIAAAEKKQ